MAFYERIVEMQGSLERVARALPGFAGYLRKEDRRAADELLREKIVRTYSESLDTLNRLANQLVDKGGMRHMERVQRIDTGLVTFIDGVRAAARGYGGAFDAVKVDEERLARLYSFDEALLVYQDQLSAGLIAFRDAIGGEDLESVLDQMEKLVADLNTVLAGRSEAILSLGSN